MALGLFALCAGILLEWRNDESRQADEMAATAAAAVAHDVTRNIELFDLSLQAVSSGLQMPGIWDLSEQIRKLVLFNRATGAHYLGFINALDENGNVIADSQPTQNANNWSVRDYFIHHRSDKSMDIYISRPFALGSETQASIAISRRMSRPDGSFAGVVVGSMNLAYFRDLFSKLALGPHGSIALLRDDGVVLMRLPFTLNAIGDVIDAGSSFGNSLRAEAPHAAAEDPIDHVWRDFSFRRIGGAPLIVSVGLANEDIHAASWMHTIILVPAAAFLLVTVWLVVALRHQWDQQEANAVTLRRSNDDLEALADQRARARTAAKRDSDARSHFLAAISHEMRTPLNGILGYAQLLRADDGADTVRSQRVEAMLSAGEHLRHLLNRAHDYSQLDAGGPEPHMQRIDMPGLLAECCAMIEPSALTRGLKVQSMIASSVPRHFVTDGTHLRQVLLNLLNNAVKFTKAGWVELRATGVDGQVRIEVADTGPGVPADRQVQQFRSRSDTVASTAEGTGSGLLIATQLIHGLDGEIGYRDNPGGGSVFWLELPEGVEQAPSAKAGGAPTDAPGRVLRILVADDHADNRNVAAAFLRDAGHQVVQVSDGRAAVKEAAANDFDVVLMDVHMPGLNGLDATRTIRALRGPRGSVPIIALTGDVFYPDVEKFLRAGMTSHVKKPVDRTELLTAVNVAAGLPRAAATATAGEPKQSPDDTDPADTPVFDRGILAELASCMSADDLNGHLRSLGLRIEALLGQLSDPDGLANAEELADTLHGLAGSAGTLGFCRLSGEARQFETAIERKAGQVAPRAGNLADIAREALAELVEVTDPPGAIRAQRR